MALQRGPQRSGHECPTCVSAVLLLRGRDRVPRLTGWVWCPPRVGVLWCWRRPLPGTKRVCLCMEAALDK